MVGSSAGRAAAQISKSVEKNAARTPPKTDPITGDKVLFYSKHFFVGVSIGCFVMVIGMWLISLQASPWDKLADTIVFSVIILGFFIGGIAALLTVFRNKIVISNESIRKYQTFSTRQVLWADIASINFSIATGDNSFLLKDNRGRKIRVDFKMKGIGYLVECIEKNLQPEVYAKAKRYMDELKAFEGSPDQE